jgi:predicted RNase H-like nuclease (RuvC/YqgF family)
MKRSTLLNLTSKDSKISNLESKIKILRSENQLLKRNLRHADDKIEELQNTLLCNVKKLNGR